MAKREMTQKEFAAMGGRARTGSLTPEERAELARKAGKARWVKQKQASKKSAK